MGRHQGNVPFNVLNASRNAAAPRTTNKYEGHATERELFLVQPALQAGSSDTFTAIAILVVAIGLVGLAILILFSKKKI
jgi:hypothetical protein